MTFLFLVNSKLKYFSISVLTIAFCIPLLSYGFIFLLPEDHPLVVFHNDGLKSGMLSWS